MITLTVAEIKDLAECAGFVFNQHFMPDADDMETEITINTCPASGVLDDDNKPTHYAHIAYFSEYPEEGCYPLGSETEKAPDVCPKCNQPWIAHEFGVPMPSCP